MHRPGEPAARDLSTVLRPGGMSLQVADAAEPRSFHAEWKGRHPPADAARDGDSGTMASPHPAPPADPTKLGGGAPILPGSDRDAIQPLAKLAPDDEIGIALSAVVAAAPRPTPGLDGGAKASLPAPTRPAMAIEVPKEMRHPNEGPEPKARQVGAESPLLPAADSPSTFPRHVARQAEPIVPAPAPGGPEPGSVRVAEAAFRPAPDEDPAAPDRSMVRPDVPAAEGAGDLRQSQGSRTGHGRAALSAGPVQGLARPQDGGPSLDHPQAITTTTEVAVERTAPGSDHAVAGHWQHKKADLSTGAGLQTGVMGREPENSAAFPRRPSPPISPVAARPPAPGADHTVQTPVTGGPTARGPGPRHPGNAEGIDPPTNRAPSGGGQVVGRREAAGPAPWGGADPAPGAAVDTPEVMAPSAPRLNGPMPAAVSAPGSAETGPGAPAASLNQPSAVREVPEEVTLLRASESEADATRARPAGEATNSKAVGHATTARAVIAQIRDVVVSGDRLGTEVRLNPEELGRVRLTFSGAEAASLVLIQVERPETLDLLRRNLDLLRAELQAEGYAGLELSLGHEAPTHQDGTAGTWIAAMPQGDAGRGPETASDLSSEPTRGVGQTLPGRLDIRL